MPGQPPTLRRILFAAVAALTIGLGAVSVVTGFSDSPPVRLLQGIAIFGAGAACQAVAALVVETPRGSAGQAASRRAVAGGVGLSDHFRSWRAMTMRWIWLVPS